MKKAAICTIGDEILIGQIVDTNSAGIAKELNSIGVKVERIVSVQDDDADIRQNIDVLLQTFDIVITTGGLGPTKDDITKRVLKDLSGSKSYKKDEAQFEIVKQMLIVKGIELSDINIAQAFVPSNAEVIVNKLGTAPCMVFRFPAGKYPQSPTLYSLPGVPFETYGLIPKVLKDIKEHNLLEDIHHKTISTFGIPESTLADMIKKWENALPKEMKLAYLPNIVNGVKLRLSIYGGKKEEEIKKINEEFAKLSLIIGDAIYGEGDDTLYTAIAKLLVKNHKTLSVAESCTGGKIASLITSVSGASEYFYGSVTSYDNSVKHNILNVSNEILTLNGAVSKECAEAMALGAKKALGTDFAISTTGIAGPTGGTPEKPVGTVWVGIAYDNPATGKPEAESKMFQFSGSRTINIERFSSNALNFLRLKLVSVLPA